YFHKTHRFFNTDPELESNIMMEVGKQPEVKFNLTLDSLKDINKDKEIRLIESLLSFENTPQIKYDSALFELEQINCDESNGINQLLDGF
ncbi:hypothetical protein PVC22_004503, partial [Salmonella enterica subsp. enterica serovar Infantis]|nr:hypothetical protein [Salmonella enterica subsp. enterica serovar Infantis]HBB7088261.1 hypothetical protein [Escherichia coli]